MTATIAAEMGEVAVGSTHYHVLFLIGIILFLISLVVNMIASAVVFKQRSQRGANSFMNPAKILSSNSARRKAIQVAGFAGLSLVTLVTIIPIFLILGYDLYQGSSGHFLGIPDGIPQRGHARQGVSSLPSWAPFI